MANPGRQTEVPSEGAKNDLLASIVVFLVALPLCMGVAIASGTPVASGILAGVVGGIITGMLSGCPLQVSGPAAGLTVIVLGIVQTLGLQQLGLVVLMAGLIQILAALLRLGNWFRAVSPAVIRGMLAGIGFLIIGSQLHVMLDDPPPGGGARNLSEFPLALRQAGEPLKLAPAEQRRSVISAIQSAREIHSLQNTIWKSLPGEFNDSEPRGGHAQGARKLSKVSIDFKAIAKDQQSILERLQALHFSQRNFSAERHLSSARYFAKAAVEALSEENLNQTRIEVKNTLEEVTVLLNSLKSRNWAGLLGLLTIVIIVLWSELRPEALRFFPPALVAVILVTGIAGWWQLPVYYIDLPDNLWTSIQLPTRELFFRAEWLAIIQQGLIVAVVASAETLLCASAVDQMHHGQRTNYDRELLAQGVGNSLCGLIGALPITGVIVRSSANVQAGGKTRLSAILHGFWLIAFVAGMTSLLRLIPTSCLAAILVVTGYKLIDIKSIRELRGFGWGEVVIYAVTVAVIVFEDLLTGVLVGILLSAIKIMHMLSHLRIHTQSPRQDERILQLDGAATFLRLPAIALALEKIPPRLRVHIELGDLDYIDHACLDLLQTWTEQYESSGGEVNLEWDMLHTRYRRDRFRGKNAPGIAVQGSLMSSPTENNHNSAL